MGCDRESGGLGAGETGQLGPEKDGVMGGSKKVPHDILYSPSFKVLREFAALPILFSQEMITESGSTRDLHSLRNWRGFF